MKKLGFRTKMFIYYSLIVLLIIMIGFGAVYGYIVKRLEAEIIQNMELSSKEMTGQMDSILKEMDHMAIEIVANPIVQKYMYEQKKTGNMEQYNDLQNMTYDTLISLSAVNLGAFRVSLYNQSGSYTSIGIPTEQKKIEKQMGMQGYKAWYELLRPERNTRKVLLPHEDFWAGDEADQMISVIREIVDINSYSSFVLVEVQYPVKKLERIFTNKFDQKQFLFSEDGYVIYSKDDDTDENDFILEILKHINNEKGTNSICCRVSGEQGYLSFRKSAEADWYFAVFRSQSTLNRAVYPIIGVVLLITLLILTVMLIFTALIARHLTKPLNILQQKIHDMNDEGQVDSFPENVKDRKDEIWMIDTAFNTLHQNLLESQNELNCMKVQEIKMQMLAVQAQMNPHFLYNTLSIISAISLDYQAYEVMDICKALSSMLRYSGSFTYERVALEDEVVHTCNYLDLMHCRFKENIEYQIQVQEEVKRVLVPKLILQPIVENCFQHGFAETKPPWKVYVEGGISENRWFLRVMDNGGGFSKSTLEMLEQKLDHWQDNINDDIGNLGIGGYGLVNVIIRLKITYGKEGTFLIYNTQRENEKFCVVELGGDLRV